MDATERVASEAELVASNSPDEIFKRLGEVYEFFLDRPEDAIICYEQSMVLGGDTFDVPERLLSLYVATETWEKAHVLAGALVEQATPGSRGRFEILLMLGDILFSGLGQVDAAQEVYRTAFESDPSNIQALERLGHLYATTSNHDAMRQLYSAFLANVSDDVGTKAEVLARYGDQLITTSNRW